MRAAFLVRLLAGSLPLLAAPVGAASFDCRKAETPDERTICSHPGLNDSDVEMATTYKLLAGLMAMGARGALQDSQQDFLTRRRACGDNLACLQQVYKTRLEELQAIYDHIPKPL